MTRASEMVKLAVTALEDKKAVDIRVLDIEKISTIADYFIIASGANRNQVQAMADQVEETLGKESGGTEPRWNWINSADVRPDRREKDPCAEKSSGCGRILFLCAIPAVSWSTHKAENSDHLTQNLQLTFDDDRFHEIVFRLQTVISIFFVKGFYSGGIIHQSHHHLPVSSCRLLFHQNIVPVQDSNVYHAFTFYFQKKGLIVWKTVRGYGKIGLNPLYCQQWLTCRYLTDNRYFYQIVLGVGNRLLRAGDPLQALFLKNIIKDFNSPWLGGVFLDVSVLLKRFQMGMYGRSGF